MNRYSIAITGGVVAAIVFALPVVGRDHNALNGTWTLVAARSDFAGEPALQSATVKINEREGNITVSRNFVYANGGNTVFYNDMTDSANHATIQNGKDLKSKTRWDHDVLKVTTIQAGATTVESYSLAPDATMMVSVVKPERKPITLVFQRQ